MGLKLLVAVLVVMLSGVNSSLSSLCTAYCMSSTSATGAAAHSHQMKSQTGSASTRQRLHAHHQGTECAECPPNSGKSLNQKADCASLIQIEALKEGSFNLDAPRGLALLDAADTPVRAVGLFWDDERSLVFDASRTSKSSPSPSLPLRI